MKINLLKKFRKIAKEKVFLDCGISDTDVCIVYVEGFGKKEKTFYYNRHLEYFSPDFHFDNDYNLFENIEDALPYLVKARRQYIKMLLRKKREKSKGEMIRDEQSFKNYKQRLKFLKTF